MSFPWQHQFRLRLTQNKRTSSPEVKEFPKKIKSNLFNYFLLFTFSSRSRIPLSNVLERLTPVKSFQLEYLLLATVTFFVWIFPSVSFTNRSPRATFILILSKQKQRSVLKNESKNILGKV